MTVTFDGNGATEGSVPTAVTSAAGAELVLPGAGTLRKGPCKLRELVDGRILFDIPTEAEWEVACRAGSTNYWNDGSAALRTNREGYEHAQADLNLDRLGRYCQNGGERPGKDPVPPDDCDTTSF